MKTGILISALAMAMFFTLATVAATETHQFVLGTVWFDSDGNPINAHGGGVIFYQGVYYWYGEHKLPGKSEAESADGGVHCYSSTNLYDWKNEGLVLPVNYTNSQHDLAYGCILERPKVLFNERTRMFVMFFKFYQRGAGYETGYVGVATSTSPAGPFDYRHKFLGAGSSKGSGDFAIYQDVDGAAYHLTVRKPDRAFCMGKLRPDYLFPEGEYHVIASIPAETEAPAVARRNGKYYLVGSGSSGWSPNAARSFVADSLSGPWRNTGNPCAGVNSHNGLGPDKTFGGQISCIIPVAGKRDAFIAMFDVWMPERAAEGLYLWLPVRINDQALNITWRNRWDLLVFDSNGRD